MEQQPWPPPPPQPPPPATAAAGAPPQPSAELDGEVDDDVARLAGDVVDADLVAVALLDLVQQRQRIVVVDEAHDLAVLERLERTEDGGMAESACSAAHRRVVSALSDILDLPLGSGLEPAAGIAARES